VPSAASTVRALAATEVLRGGRRPTRLVYIHIQLFLSQKNNISGDRTTDRRPGLRYNVTRLPPSNAACKRNVGQCHSTFEFLATNLNSAYGIIKGYMIWVITQRQVWVASLRVFLPGGPRRTCLTSSLSLWICSQLFLSSTSMDLLSWALRMIRAKFSMPAQLSRRCRRCRSGLVGHVLILRSILLELCFVPFVQIMLG